MSLSRLLNEQRERLEALSRLLAEEQERLIAGRIDGEALTRIAGEKSRLLAALEVSEASRLRVQGRLGYSPDASGASQAAADAGCLMHWQALLELAADTARANERNGRLVALRMQHNRELLDYLQRIAEKRVYTADGRPRADSGRVDTSA